MKDVSNRWTRRRWLGWLASTLAASSASCRGPGKGSANDASPPPEPPAALPLSEFEPRSMLHVAETRIERSRFPVIDFHTHLSWSAVPLGSEPYGETIDVLEIPSSLLPVMDRKNLRTMVNLTGGAGKGLEQALAQFDHAHPGRFVTFTEPSWSSVGRADYPQFQAEQIEMAYHAGAKGLKVTKTLGLYLRTGITSGPLIEVDDPRFDPMWEVCGALSIPVAIHVSDPEAFFLPIDRFNERYEELANHPDWSFHGSDYPSNEELLEARNRVLARHPKTHFVTLHVGNNAENLDYVGECMDRYPNMSVEIGARIGELGRQPRASRRFFDKYQDRILFGTDAVPPPRGNETPQQIFSDRLYEIYFRFLETEDEYFDYAPAPVPPQGRWRIYGLGLTDPILEKIYFSNSARILKLS